MGNKLSSKSSVDKESDSIVKACHREYSTHSGSAAATTQTQTRVTEQTEIVKGQPVKSVYREETQIWRTKQGKDGTCSSSHQKVLRIAFNRKDMSAPLAQTVEDISTF